ncbi:hypothetical protein SAMN02799624_00703 [Paenibacillus sp. UNC496MF]|uniref:hypothetical protein n=1 Tax=Paenibacillus sp. UNC496MF TaxID=1502753 RepID=UPI0008EDC245|nr:hypothetical protein [Paenibacillus sp. UNC496MF]SFI38008.1 hypothetical protein SAMN02799624_00703 [Paenibacillus sp. UNC496MF]
MPYSTGIVTNTRDIGSAAANVVVNARNLDLANPLLVIVKLFASADSSVFYTPYLVSYTVPPDSYDVRMFGVAGNVAYEVQMYTSLLPPSVALSVYGINEFGNLVTDQHFRQNDLNGILGLSPSK